ncbi:hypothetical protein HO133_008215 [Letharia lupina]|uniref:Uncharacterized protein n=1 Tax=Letharia lupina TaxID=560253 RepID=A0A8H6FHI1_9LECA|nr:uncharacterized protein HO133_008215 [Letharia lupina]KAF6228485.1 hypothetical protein HO133_008215 [Letharia lupina]
MSASLLSPFECLLAGVKQPISVNIRLYHPAYSPAFPTTYLHSFLPLVSKLSLRRVSPITKAWVDSADPSVFSNLSLLFPLNIFSTEELSALHNISPQCEHLTVTVAQHTPVPRRNDVTPLPSFPRLEHLDLTAPDDDPFQGLLSFRLALQCANIPLLTHLTINNLSFSGIQALRWGSFTSFGDAGWTGGIVWHGLKELDVKVVRRHDDKTQEKEHHLNHEAAQWDTEPVKARRRVEEDWRTCTRVLHDWLHSFAADGQLHTFRFEWVDGEGPNPFLLDEYASVEGKKEWFSAPRIRWTGLRELWLGNMIVSLMDIRLMKERMRGLERLVVRSECLNHGLEGITFAADGKMWVGLLVEGHRMGLWSGVKHSLSSAGARGGCYRESLLSEDRASMVLPFMLDVSPEDDTCLELASSSASPHPSSGVLSASYLAENQPH